MSDFFDVGKGDDVTRMPSHTKRVGRELAMLYLFGSGMNGDVVLRERSDFFDAASGIMHWKATDRMFRKGREYAEQLLDIFTRHQDEVDEKIKTLSSNWEWDRISLVDRNIMRVAVCEMLYVADVPPVVSINEAVEVALDYSDENSGNFINGILNALKDNLNRPAREAVDRL